MCYMHSMNLASLDLNLLVALDALVSEAHVGRAAQRIGLSQPATSHALARLREIMSDPLLVRVGARMELTPRAQGLRAQVAYALEQVRGVFSSRDFDPAVSTRRFLLVMPDLVVDTLMPPILKRLEEEAPQIRLDVTPWRSPTMMTDEIAGTIDVAICCLVDPLPGFNRQRLYADTDVLAVRRGHPVGRRLGRLEDFCGARHVAVIGLRRPEDYIDVWLRGLGVERRIGLTVPTYLQALRMAALTDLVAFVPSRVVNALCEPLSLQLVHPPLNPGTDEQYLFYPSRAQADPASVWIRNLILQVARELPDAGALGTGPRRGSQKSRLLRGRQDLRIIARGAARDRG
jgi:DNA-binding transcriptional LysR family regulator